MSEPAPPVHSLSPLPLPLSNQSMISPPTPQQSDPLPNLTTIIATTLELAKNNPYCHSSTPSKVNLLQDKSQSMPITTSPTSPNVSSNPNHSHPPTSAGANTHQLQTCPKNNIHKLTLNILFTLSSFEYQSNQHSRPGRKTFEMAPSDIQ